MDNKIASTMGGYHGSDVERVMRGLAGAGFRHVEVTAIPSPRSRIQPEQMGPEGIAAFRARLAHHGLAPVSVSGHSDLTQKEGVDHFKTRIDFAVALGVDIVNTGAGHGKSPEE